MDIISPIYTMKSALSGKELHKAKSLVKHSTPNNLAKNLKSANDLIIKALYDSRVSYADTCDYIHNELDLYAPLNIQCGINKNLIQKDDVKLWANTVDFNVSKAEHFCIRSISNYMPVSQAKDRQLIKQFKSLADKAC